MKKIVVIYESKYGSTKRYANWLAGKFQCPAINRNSCTVDMLQNYETIIYGGPIYGTIIKGLSFIKDNLSELANKNIIVFAVGLCPKDEKTIKLLKDYNFSEEMDNIPLFFCRGAFKSSILDDDDRRLIEFVRKAFTVNNIIFYQNMECDFLSAINGDEDWVSEAELQPILDYVANNIKLISLII